ncbi:DUF6886 family protein [Paenibacillus silvisoli]|uniref:DUF6886 family protein n=1 Tax=Paenibacillus silvisoli TaxID=3110539 RepID=UPI00389925D1
MMPTQAIIRQSKPFKPVAVDRVDDLLGYLAEAPVELRITPSLMPLKRAILASTVNFSMIRMKNAVE